MMTEQNAQQISYHKLSRILHWATALIILSLIPIGFFMGELSNSNPVKFKLYMLHKSFGLTVLGLLFLRVIILLVTTHPHSLPTHKHWEVLLAKFIHFSLYALLLFLPLSGWIMSSAGEFPVPFFGLFHMPDLVGKNEALFILMRSSHEILAIIIVGAVGLHFAGALKHHLIDRDTTLARMLPVAEKSKTVMVVIALIAAASLAIGAFFSVKEMRHMLYSEQSIEKPEQNTPRASTQNSTPDYMADVEISQEAAGQEAIGIKLSENNAHENNNETTRNDTARNEAKNSDVAQDSPYSWQIDQQKSNISFQASLYGQNFEGVFGTVSGQVVFDTDHLNESHVNIGVIIQDLKTGSADRDMNIQTDTWLDSESFPESRFVASSFEKIKQNQYVAHGHLTIKSITKPLDFVFTFEDAEISAGGQSGTVAGIFVINRLDFDVGQGEWSDSDTVGHSVKVKVLLHAERNTGHNQ